MCLYFNILAIKISIFVYCLFQDLRFGSVSIWIIAWDRQLTFSDIYKIYRVDFESTNIGDVIDIY